MDAILVKREGKVSMDKSFDYLCSLIPNGVFTVSIKRVTEKRTVSQNDLMWLWFTCIEEITDTSKKDIHDYYCSLFLSRKTTVNGKEVTVVGGTSSLNTIQMSKFMNKIQADAASELGINLPLPSDRYYQQFVDEYRRR